MEKKEYINGTAIVVLEIPCQRVIIKQLTDEEVKLVDDESFFEKFCRDHALDPADCSYMVGDNIHVEKI